LNSNQTLDTLKMETQKKKKIGILGGTFDPPTICHIQMAAEAVNLRYVEEVWVIPCGTRTDKLFGTPGEHRLAMTHLLVNDFFPKEFPIKVNDIEIRNGRTIPTYDLIQKLKEDPENEKYDFYFILGSDLLEGLRKWENGLKLMEEVNFIIFIRIGFFVRKENLPKKYIIVFTSFIGSSSTEIRNRIAALRNQGTLEVTNPELKRRMSIDEEVDEKPNPEISEIKQVREQKLRTIDGNKQQEVMSPEDRNKYLEDEYLGIYGIVPSSIIKYIKDHGLYLFKK